MLAGAAFAAGGSDMSLATAAKDGDRAAVQFVERPRKQDVAVSKVRTRWSGLPPTTIWRWSIFFCTQARM